MRSASALTLVTVGLLAACGAHAGEPRRGGHPPGRGFVGWEQLTGLGAEMRGRARTKSLECTAVSMHIVEGPMHKGSYVVIVARTATGKPVLAIGAERETRMSRSELTRLRMVDSGDLVSLRGKVIDKDGHTVMIIEGMRRTPRPEGVPRLGTLQDVMRGPLPMPVLFDLSHGRRLQGRVLGMEGGRLRVRASIAELLIPANDIRTATRLGCGTTCRTSDGRIDFLSSLPLAGAVNRVFAAAAAGVTVTELNDYRVRCEVVDGVRIGRKLALLARTRETGDFLVYLYGGKARADREVNYFRRQMIYALRLTRGEEVSLRLRKSVHGLYLSPSEMSMLVGQGEGTTVPQRPRDEEFAALDRATRAALEEFVERLGDGEFEGATERIAGMSGPAQRVALRHLAHMTDWGYLPALETTHALARELPAEKIPPEIGAATVRALFVSESPGARSLAAEILGIIGCREGIGALEDARDLFGAGDFAEAAEKAIEQIKVAAPH